MRTDLPQLTIFTPTYNRKDLLKRLYMSLYKQNCKDFVWIIVDDGSSDGTKDMVNQWEKASDFEIRYIFQQNQGKSAAFNKGIDLAETELFLCVDSDDYLSNVAVNNVLVFWREYKGDNIGILARREVTKVPSKIVTGVRTTLLDAYRVHNIKGDTMIVHKLEVLKKYRFPQFENEKFVPEAYLYDKLDQHGTLVFLNEVLYHGNYNKDGYTQNMAKVIKNNPLGYEAFILQRLQRDSSLKYITTDSIRYVAVEKVLNIPFYDCIMKSPRPLLTVVSYLAGVLFYYIRYARIENETTSYM